MELGRLLRRMEYRFITPTPASHQWVNARPANAETTTVTGALGWSRPFRPGALPAEVERLLLAADVVTRSDDGLLRSTVRFSTIDPPVGERARPGLFLHSAYPPRSADGGFFGPDTYRFVHQLRRTLAPARRLVEVCAGSGAAALVLRAQAEQLVLADINPAALRFARINAALADASAVELCHSDLLSGVSGQFDAVIGHPPFMIDAERRLYRDGGGSLGLDLAVRIVEESLARLTSGGQLILYTGSPVVDGEHPLRAALAPALATRPCRHTWEELDPDVFGEELASPAYADIDRIAIVALVARVT